MLVPANMSITDMMQGDNGNIKVLLGITPFTDYLAIYMIYHCVVVFCLYNIMALYNNIFNSKLYIIFQIIPIEGNKST